MSVPPQVYEALAHALSAMNDRIVDLQASVQAIERRLAMIEARLPADGQGPLTGPERASLGDMAVVYPEPVIGGDGWKGVESA